MGMSTGSSAGVTNEINVTPMIDVLLVLLIIFMVVNALSRQVIDVQIPPAETAASQSTASNQIVLEIKANNMMAINGQEEFPIDQLDQEIHNIYDNRVTKIIFVKPAGNETYGYVMDALDIVRGAGVSVIGFTPVEAN